MQETYRGAQYKVIDLQNGRVRKLPLTAEESRAVVESWYAPGAVPREDLAIDYRRHAIESCAHIERLLGDHPELGHSFGNPVFEGDGAYTQDTVQTLGDALRKSPAAEAKLFIDAYIDLILLHWRYGIAERVFNCTVNSGVDTGGRVILFDFGEITTSKQEAEAAIVAQRWLQAWSYKNDIPEQFREYYRDSMAARLSAPVLLDTWYSGLYV